VIERQEMRARKLAEWLDENIASDIFVSLFLKEIRERILSSYKSMDNFVTGIFGSADTPQISHRDVESK